MWVLDKTKKKKKEGEKKIIEKWWWWWWWWSRQRKRNTFWTRVSLFLSSSPVRPLGSKYTGIGNRELQCVEIRRPDVSNWKKKKRMKFCLRLENIFLKNIHILMCATQLGFWSLFQDQRGIGLLRSGLRKGAKTDFLKKKKWMYLTRALLQDRNSGGWELVAGFSTGYVCKCKGKNKTNKNKTRAIKCYFVSVHIISLLTIKICRQRKDDVLSNTALTMQDSVNLGLFPFQSTCTGT